jgi:hypothetical protein
MHRMAYCCRLRAQQQQHRYASITHTASGCSSSAANCVPLLQQALTSCTGGPTVAACMRSSCGSAHHAQCAAHSLSTIPAVTTLSHSGHIPAACRRPHLMHRQLHCCRLHAQQLQSHGMHRHALRLAVECRQQAHHLDIIALAQRVQRVRLWRHGSSSSNVSASSVGIWCCHNSSLVLLYNQR